MFRFLFTLDRYEEMLLFVIQRSVSSSQIYFLVLLLVLSRFFVFAFYAQFFFCLSFGFLTSRRYLFPSLLLSFISSSDFNSHTRKYLLTRPFVGCFWRGKGNIETNTLVELHSRSSDPVIFYSCICTGLPVHLFLHPAYLAYAWVRKTTEAGLYSRRATPQFRWLV